MDLRKLPLALGLILAFACGAASAQDGGTLQKIKESGTIQIGARDSQIPFSYKLSADSAPIGFTNDICLKIVDAVKKQLAMPDIAVDYVAVTSSNI